MLKELNQGVVRASPFTYKQQLKSDLKPARSQLTPSDMIKCFESLITLIKRLGREVRRISAYQFNHLYIS